MTDSAARAAARTGSGSRSRSRPGCAGRRYGWLGVARLRRRSGDLGRRSGREHSRRRPRLGFDAGARDRRRDRRLPGRYRPGGRRQGNIGHAGTSATTAPTTRRERRIPRSQRARPEPLTAPDGQCDDQGVEQHREQQSAVAAPRGGERELERTWRVRRALGIGRMRRRRKIADGVQLLSERRAAAPRTHARGPVPGPRASMSETTPAYCAFASCGVKPMIWTPAPRATSIASTTSW